MVSSDEDYLPYLASICWVQETLWKITTSHKTDWLGVRIWVEKGLQQEVGSGHREPAFNPNSAASCMTLNVLLTSPCLHFPKSFPNTWLFRAEGAHCPRQKWYETSALIRPQWRHSNTEVKKQPSWAPNWKCNHSLQRNQNFLKSPYRKPSVPDCPWDAEENVSQSAFKHSSYRTPQAFLSKQTNKVWQRLIPSANERLNRKPWTRVAAIKGCWW